jgi:hypothetical protein
MRAKSLEMTMPSYEICYIDRAGSLTGKIAVQCASSKDAAILAHAMKFREWLEVEVWEGEKLIYERPAVPSREANPAAREQVLSFRRFVPCHA